MLPYIYYPEIHIWKITLMTWGLIAAIGFLAATFITIKEAKRKKLNTDHVYNILFILIFAGIIGSRISHIITHWQDYSHNLWKIFAVWEGGLAFYGGFTLAVICLIIYTKIKKLNIWEYADIIIPGFVIGHAIGRIGCYVADGGHIGKATTMPWGVLYQGQLVHSTSIYSALFLFCLFGLLLYFRRKDIYIKTKGLLFLTYIMLYAIGRFMIDLLRIDTTYFGLTTTQYSLIAAFIISATIIIIKLKNERKKQIPLN